MGSSRLTNLMKVPTFAITWGGSRGWRFWMVRTLPFYHRASMQSTSSGYISLRYGWYLLRYVEYYLGPNEDEAPFPVTKFPTIQALCQAVLQRFSPVKLRQSIQGKVSAGEQIRPVEALYQDEYYRAFSSIVPGVAISSEWSFDGGGRIDFYLPSMKWGIELLRDHSRTDEHCERFLPGGRYHSWISGGMIQEWMIIDCATTIPTEGKVKSTLCSSPLLIQ